MLCHRSDWKYIKKGIDWVLDWQASNAMGNHGNKITMQGATG